MDEIKLTIDGIKVEVEKGTAVLQAAQSAGIYIPALCSHPDLPLSREVKADEFVYRGTELIKNDNSAKEFEGCQLCVVEIEGMDGLQTASRHLKVIPLPPPVTNRTSPFSIFNSDASETCP